MTTAFRATIASLLFAVTLCSQTVHGQTARKKNLGLDLPVFGSSDLAEDVDVEISASLRQLQADTVELQVTVVLPEGYHIYSMNPAQASPTTIELTSLGSLKPVDQLWTSDKEPKTGSDDLGPYEKFYGKVTWTKVLKGPFDNTTVKGHLSGQYCGSGENNVPGTCIPIRKREFTATLATAGASAQAGSSQSASSEVSPAGAETTDNNPVTVTPKIGFGKSAKEGLIEFRIGLSPEKPIVGEEVTLSIRAKIQEPWHTFALDQDPEMAGLPTTIEIDEFNGLKEIGDGFTPSSEPEVKPIDEFVQRIHHGEITWSRKYVVADPSVTVSGVVRFQMCSNGTCLPPTPAKFLLSLTAGTDPLPAGPREAARGNDPEIRETPSSTGTDSSHGMAKDGLIAFLLTAIGAGFVALLTPCVFPMIPVTVAFFLKQEEKKAGSSLTLAIVYCLAMISAFTFLGLIGSAVAGPASLTQLANSKWLNLGFGGLFLFFGVMLLGVFNLQIPSWLLTWTSKREAAGGLVGVVFMALTFTLVSFTCTFAFVGSLLVIAAKGDYLWPIIGMLGFSTAFASPFFVLAMFPSMLRKLPRSGGWMNDVKVVIGLVEIAAAVKFFSVADIGFSVGRIPVYLNYATFMVIWISLSLMAGLYLLGITRSPRPKFSVPRYLFAFLFLAFAGRLAAGVTSLQLPSDPVWNLVAAFSPPDVEVRQTEQLGYVISHHKMDFALDFDKAVEAATKEQTPLFVDFTGVNCVNCRQMERTVMVDDRVVSVLEKLVRAQLYTDEVPGITDATIRDRLRDANIALQSDLVADVTLPNYAVVSADGKTVLSVFKGLDSSGGEEFLKFLNAGLESWDNLKGTQLAQEKRETTER